MNSRTLGASLTFALLLAAACGETVIPNVNPGALDRSHSQPFISAQRAGELALAWAHTFGPYNKSFIETGFQRPVDFAKLAVSGTPYLAESTYDDLDPAYSGPDRKAFGPYYLVTLAQENVPAVAVAVSAFATDVGVSHGELELPRTAGNEFAYIGIRAGHEFPMRAVKAKSVAESATGASVIGEPILVAPPVHDFAPLYARWRVTLNRNVALAMLDGAETQVSTNTVYVDHYGKIAVEVLATRADDHVLFTGQRLRPPQRSGAAQHFSHVRLLVAGRNND